MSSILEALKKLEDEKAARRGGIGNISGRVTSAGRRAGQRSPRIMVTAMTVVAFVAVVCTYAAMKWLSPPVSLPVAANVTAPAPQATAVASPQAATTAVNATAAAVSPGPPPSQVTVRPAAPATSSLPAATAKPVARQVPSRPAAPAAKALPHPSADSGLPVLSVTGIAWQQQNASRLAVVNEVPVTEGSVIEGARVKEILPDHLRFSIDGKEFDIYMEKNPS